MGTKMSLAEFYKYARQNRKRMSDIYREIEEIQYQFNDLYSTQMQERDRLIAANAPLLLKAPEDLPLELRHLLEKQEQAELQALMEEITKLESETEDKRRQADSLIKQAQDQTAYVRGQNPILDQQEEELKARQAVIESDIAKVDAEIDQLGLFKFFERRRLGKDRAQLAENLESVKAGIRAVREKWQADKKRMQEAQTGLQSQWQALSVETAQLQARLDYLAANRDALSKRNAAENLLENLKELPVVAGPWEDRLSPLVELGHNRISYETGLTSVAEILGLLKGLGEGMDRFIRSVGTVYEEQRRYKLPPLTLDVSDAVTSFHSTWPDFQSKVKDEKYLGTHPLEFNRRIQTIVQERINEDAIQKMFDEMGAALTRATKAWR
jgi:predicted  nucleic acid-binding Zn-ribbon protein